MDKIERLKELKEALRQADANISFEEVSVDIKTKDSGKKKTKVKDDYNGKRSLGWLFNWRNECFKE